MTPHHTLAHTDATLRTIWLDPDDPDCVQIIDQRLLPGVLASAEVRSVGEMATAIRDMAVRGAGCIGVAAAFGMFLAALETRQMSLVSADATLQAAAVRLRGTRPTAVNLSWAVARQLRSILGVEDGDERVELARLVALAITQDEIDNCRRIGEHGLDIIRSIHQHTGQPVQILTHCNAGWLAFVEHGTATAPIYAAHRAGIPVHITVGETRPRSQGALTAWELGRGGVPHTMVVDNAVGHLLQRGEIDVVIVGADRATRSGDVANKIGTYLRALAAKAHAVPFYVALPSSSIDPDSRDGLRDIPIEERDPSEVTHTHGDLDGTSVQVRVSPVGTAARNPAFDVTPAALITGLITERGVCPAEESAIEVLFPEMARRVET
ncbi:MAG: S-methyl-5-thioribose-1-phosphate isomerase [Euzebya sp.]